MYIYKTSKLLSAPTYCPVCVHVIRSKIFSFFVARYLSFSWLIHGLGRLYALSFAGVHFCPLTRRLYSKSVSDI